MYEQQVFILFGEGADTNAHELNKLLKEGWRVIHTCPMPSAVSTASEIPTVHVANENDESVMSVHTRFFEPQCAIILERIQ